MEQSRALFSAPFWIPDPQDQWTVCGNLLHQPEETSLVMYMFIMHLIFTRVLISPGMVLALFQVGWVSLIHSKDEVLLKVGVWKNWARYYLHEELGILNKRKGNAKDRRRKWEQERIEEGGNDFRFFFLDPIWLHKLHLAPKANMK